MTTDTCDAVVIGGGPAGLSAAFWLGRYRRRVLVLEHGEARNEPAWAVHGYPGLPDPLPSELLRRLNQQALGAGAEFRDGEAVGVEGTKDDFVVSVRHGPAVRARRVVLAYGLRDYLPQIDGLEALYGTSVFHCPDCDGPAVADRSIGVIGWDRHGASLALYLRHWSPEITLLPHDHALDLSDTAATTLRNAGIRVRASSAASSGTAAT
jgi:thioredoxin reductase